MSTTTLTCPQCESVAPCPTEFLGRKVRCKSCRHLFMATTGEVEPAPIKPSKRRAEEQEAPPPYVPPKSSPLTIMVALLFGLLLLGGGASLIYYSVISSIPQNIDSNMKLSGESNKNADEMIVRDHKLGLSFLFPNKAQEIKWPVVLPSRQTAEVSAWECNTPTTKYRVGFFRSGLERGDAIAHLDTMIHAFIPEPQAATDQLLVKRTTVQNQPALEVDSAIGGVNRVLRLVYANNGVYVVVMTGTRLMSMSKLDRRSYDSFAFSPL